MPGTVPVILNAFTFCGELCDNKFSSIMPYACTWICA